MEGGHRGQVLDPIMADEIPTRDYLAGVGATPSDLAALPIVDRVAIFNESPAATGTATTRSKLINDDISNPRPLWDQIYSSSHNLDAVNGDNSFVLVQLGGAGSVAVSARQYYALFPNPAFRHFIVEPTRQRTGPLWSRWALNALQNPPRRDFVAMQTGVVAQMRRDGMGQSDIDAALAAYVGGAHGQPETDRVVYNLRGLTQAEYNALPLPAGVRPVGAPVAAPPPPPARAAPAGRQQGRPPLHPGRGQRGAPPVAAAGPEAAAHRQYPVVDDPANGHLPDRLQEDILAGAIDAAGTPILAVAFSQFVEERLKPWTEARLGGLGILEENPGDRRMSEFYCPFIWTCIRELGGVQGIPDSWATYGGRMNQQAPANPNDDNRSLFNIMRGDYIVPLAGVAGADVVAAQMSARLAALPAGPYQQSEIAAARAMSGVGAAPSEGAMASVSRVPYIESWARVPAGAVVQAVTVMGDQSAMMRFVRTSSQGQQFGYLVTTDRAENRNMVGILLTDAEAARVIPARRPEDMICIVRVYNGSTLVARGYARFQATQRGGKKTRKRRTLRGGVFLADGADTCVVAPHIPCPGFVPTPGALYVSRLVAPGSQDLATETDLKRMYPVVAGFGMIAVHETSCPLTAAERAAADPAAFPVGGAGGGGCARAQAREAANPAGPAHINMITKRYLGTMYQLNGAGLPGFTPGTAAQTRALRQVLASSLVAALALTPEPEMPGGQHTPWIIHTDLHMRNLGVQLAIGGNRPIVFGSLADFGRTLRIDNINDPASIRAGIDGWARIAYGDPGVGVAGPSAREIFDGLLAYPHEFPQHPKSLLRTLQAMYIAIEGGAPGFTQQAAYTNGLNALRGWMVHSLTGKAETLNRPTRRDLIALLTRGPDKYIGVQDLLDAYERAARSAPSAAGNVYMDIAHEWFDMPVGVSMRSASSASQSGRAYVTGMPSGHAMIVESVQGGPRVSFPELAQVPGAVVAPAPNREQLAAAAGAGGPLPAIPSVFGLAAAAAAVGLGPAAAGAAGGPAGYIFVVKPGMTGVRFGAAPSGEQLMAYVAGAAAAAAAPAPARAAAPAPAWQAPAPAPAWQAPAPAPAWQAPAPAPAPAWQAPAPAPAPAWQAPAPGVAYGQGIAFGQPRVVQPLFGAAPGVFQYRPGQLPPNFDPRGPGGPRYRRNGGGSTRHRSSLPTRRAGRSSSSRKRRYTHRRRA